MGERTLEELVAEAAAHGVEEHLARFVRRLVDPEPLTYTIPQAAVVIGTSDTTVRKLVNAGRLPLVPHMGERRLIPRIAVDAFVHSGMRPADVQAAAELRAVS